MNEVVSTIVRMHDPKAVGNLSRALQSLHAQVEVPVNPIIVTQRFTQTELDAVRATVEREWFFSWQGRPLLVNYEGALPDARSALLNLGLRRHMELQNRYVAFLDYDDFLYSDAYKHLSARLRDCDSVIAFGGVELVKVVPLHDYDFLYDLSHPVAGRNKLHLMRDNFCPLHSYLIDTGKVRSEELYFREDLTRVEDYDFLLRLAGRYPCDFSNLSKFLGAYCMRSDGTNTTPCGSGTDQDLGRTRVWGENRRRLDALRSTYEIRLFASDF